MDSQVHDLTAREWDALKAAWGGCAYCRTTGVALQKDCMLPIANGGRYTVANVVPACRSCNASKCNVELIMWMRRKKLDENGFLLLQSEIVRAVRDPRPDAALPETPTGRAE